VYEVSFVLRGSGFSWSSGNLGTDCFATEAEDIIFVTKLAQRSNGGMNDISVIAGTK
jgi:hypothetical protein